MPRNNDTDMSELEREFELEMDGDEGESEQDEELESDWEAQSDDEADEEADEEWESEPTEAGGYANRFYELSQREFESESELDDAVRGLVNEMERDFFFKGIWRKVKKAGQRFLKKGLGQLAGRLPIFKGLKAITQLARGNLKGALGSLAKSGLTAALSAHPAGAAILPALKGLGFEAAESPERNREAWENYVGVAREAFNHLAENLDERAADPLEASRLASNAFQTAVQKARARVRSGGGRGPGRRGRTLTIRVRSGERIIIEGI